LGVRGANVKLTSSRHRISRVDDEVHQHLFELPWIRVDCLNGGVEGYLELDIFSDEAAEHLLEAADDVVNVHHSWLHHLLPAEREQLSSETGGTIRSRRNLLHVLTVLTRTEPLYEHCAVAHDHREEVIEVVSDAARELSDGLHFGCLTNLRLQRSPFSGVDERHHRRNDLPFLIENRCAFHHERSHLLPSMNLHVVHGCGFTC